MSYKTILNRKMSGELIALRVQYLVDLDPFSSLSSYPVPSRAPIHSFLPTVPLANQLGGLLRVLGAPQRVRRKNVLRESSPKNKLFGG